MNNQSQDKYLNNVDAMRAGLKKVYKENVEIAVEKINKLRESKDLSKLNRDQRAMFANAKKEATLFLVTEDSGIHYRKLAADLENLILILNSQPNKEETSVNQSEQINPAQYQGFGFGQAFLEYLLRPLHGIASSDPADFAENVEKAQNKLDELNTLYEERDVLTLDDHYLDYIEKVRKNAMENLREGTHPEIVFKHLDKAKQILEAAPIRQRQQALNMLSEITELMEEKDLAGQDLPFRLSVEAIVQRSKAALEDNSIDADNILIGLNVAKDMLERIEDKQSVELDSRDRSFMTSLALMLGMADLITQLKKADGRTKIHVDLGDLPQDQAHKAIDWVVNEITRERNPMSPERALSVPKSNDDSAGNPELLSDGVPVRAELKISLVSDYPRIREDEAAIDAIAQVRGKFATSTSPAPSLDAVAQVRESSRVAADFPKQPVCKEQLTFGTPKTPEALYTEIKQSAQESFDLTEDYKTYELVSHDPRTAYEVFKSELHKFEKANHGQSNLTPPQLRKSFAKLFGFLVSLDDLGSPISIELRVYYGLPTNHGRANGIMLKAKLGSGAGAQQIIQGFGVTPVAQ